ncbi:metallophosphoesterase [Pasteurellaceae bacterium Pebbles2]|nr:metallophosphoesterase [Pasteurellaceae bacterium Pebbles2]
MELRHYITFAVAVVLLQLFIYIFNRTLFWLFSGKISHRVRYFLSSATYLSLNAIILLTVFRIQPMFRLSAFILAFLLFSAFVSIGLAIFSHLFRNSTKINRTLRLIYPIALASLLGLSVYNAYTPKVIHYQIQIDKPIKPLRIGMASDLHLGKLFGTKQLDQLAEIFSQQNVDLILLPGDIMDDNVNAYLAEQMQLHLAKLRAPLGVFATLGNHDFFGDQQRIVDEIQKAGIQVLLDQAIEINQAFTLIGRNDDLYHSRPNTETLLQGVNRQLPIFLLDHRPTEIDQHAQLAIDLQVSGHTHRGQIFPANLITSLMYRLDYGHEKIQNSHFIVSSGYGFWGIPMRLGTQSEVVIIDVKGK